MRAAKCSVQHAARLPFQPFGIGVCLRLRCAVRLRAALPAQQLIHCNMKQIGNHRQQHQIRQAFIPLPAADRFIGHPQLIGQLFLRQAVCAPQRGNQRADGFTLHFSFLLC